jgi:GT2 family glycosyltransferase
MITRLKMESHKIYLKNSGFLHGVSRARQAIVDWAMETGDYDYFLRVDDDVILEPDYIERMLKVIEGGYDIASGVTVAMAQPFFKRDPVHLKGIINRVVLNDDGSYFWNGDDCGMEYIDSVILPAHHFRSCALIKKEVHKKIKYYPTKLSMNGFREEQIFSYKALMEGFRIGVDTGAKNYHLICPSGGERDTMNQVPYNQKVLEEFTKENKDKLNNLFPKEPVITELERMKEVNMAR